MDLYHELSRSNHGYKLNMPEEEARVFLALFDSTRWSWTGLAKLMVARFSAVDMEDFVSCLQIAAKGKQGKKKEATPALVDPLPVKKKGK